MEADGAEGSLLVGIAVTLVFIEGKVAVGPGINPYLKAVPGLLGSILHIRADWKHGSAFYKNRDYVRVHAAGEGDAAVKTHSVPESHPVSFGQIRLQNVVLTKDRCDQKAVAEQEFILDAFCSGVFRKERTHERSPLGSDLPGLAVYIGKQPVTQPDGAFLDIKIGISTLSKLENLPGRMCPVASHHAGEHRQLHPPVIELPETGIPVPARVCFGTEETSDVGIMVRDAAKRQVKGRSYLVPEAFPAGNKVSGPHMGAVTLKTCGSAARENHHTAAAGKGTLVVVHSAHAVQRETVAEGPVSSQRALIVIIPGLYGLVFRFRGIQPPAVQSGVPEVFLHI